MMAPPRPKSRRWAHYRRILGGPRQRSYGTPAATLGASLYAHHDERGRWQDTAATTPALAFNDPCDRWDDQSGNGRHVVFGDITFFGVATDPVLIGPLLNGRLSVGSGLISNNGPGIIRQLVSDGADFEGAKDFTFIGVIQSGDESYASLFEVLEADGWHFRSIYNTDIDTDPGEATIIQHAADPTAPLSAYRFIDLDGPDGDNFWNQQQGPEQFTIPPRIVAWQASWTRANVAMWVNGTKYGIASLPVTLLDTGDAVITPEASHLPCFTRFKDLSRYWEVIVAEGIPTAAQFSELHGFLATKYSMGGITY
jgi:hypothetical protein